MPHIPSLRGVDLSNKPQGHSLDVQFDLSMKQQRLQKNGCMALDLAEAAWVGDGLEMPCRIQAGAERMLWQHGLMAWNGEDCRQHLEIALCEELRATGSEIPGINQHSEPPQDFVGAHALHSQDTDM